MSTTRRSTGYVHQKVNTQRKDAHHKAMQLQGLGQFLDAGNIYRGILKADPGNYRASINLGICLLSSGIYQEAALIFHKLHEHNPEDRTVLDLCAKCYFYMQRFDLSISFWKRILRKEPENFEVWSNLALAAGSSSCDIDALAYAMKALEISPCSADAHNNVGAALLALSRVSEATECFKTALELSPNRTDTLSNLGIVMQRQGDHQSAITNFRSCLLTSFNGTQQHTDLLYKMSFSLLATQQFIEGWEAAEAGFKVLGLSSRNPKRHFRVNQWTGEKLEGKRILVWREQGLGDELFLYSMLPDLIATGAKVLIESDTRLIGMLSRSFPDAEVRPQSFDSLSGESTVEDYDFHSPLGSLARFFRRSVDDFLKNRGAYLVPDSRLVQVFEERIEHRPGLKIGISWRTGLDFSNRAVNMTTLNDWFPWLLFEDVTFVNLFYGNCEAEIRALEANWGVDILRWSDVDLRNDQESLAAIMCNLDLVISSDSAPAMLAGALGLPLYMYGELGSNNFGTKKFPWFPHCKYFSPPDKAMASVIPLVAQAVENDYGLKSITKQHQLC